MHELVCDVAHPQLPAGVAEADEDLVLRSGEFRVAAHLRVAPTVEDVSDVDEPFVGGELGRREREHGTSWASRANHGCDAVNSPLERRNSEFTLLNFEGNTFGIG